MELRWAACPAGLLWKSFSRNFHVFLFTANSLGGCSDMEGCCVIFSMETHSTCAACFLHTFSAGFVYFVGNWERYKFHLIMHCRLLRLASDRMINWARQRLDKRINILNRKVSGSLNGSRQLVNSAAAIHINS